MKLADSKKLMAADVEAAEFGVSSLELMENASEAVADAAAELAGDNLSCVVFCGSGNNGGDGFGAAAELCRRGFTVSAFLLGNSEKMSPESWTMADRLQKFGVEIEAFDPDDDYMKSVANDCGVIIDAIFGVGLSREVGGIYKDAIEIINASPASVVSADIASGVEADTGRILGCAVKATVTVTFTMAKAGHFITPGMNMRGRLVVKNIGVPEKLVAKAVGNVRAITVNDMFIPHRNSDSSKWDYGKVMIVAGCKGYTGAPIMASKAAVRTGSGLVFLSVPESIYEIAAMKSDEVMVTPYPCDDEGCFSVKACEKLIKRLNNCDVCLLGCGLGRGSETKEFVANIIRNCKVPLVLDADGINAISENIDILKEASCPIIVTPHEREFVRMGGDLSQGRLKGALSFAAEYGCAVVLKGSGTITALPRGGVYVNTTGNAGMAKGGSGDVLAGMISSFIGQNFPPAQAAVYGTLLHGYVGDLCKKQLTEYAMTPMDMINSLPEAFKNLLRK